MFNDLARHRIQSIILVGLLSFTGSWLWAMYRGMPVPYIHDEFNYLLAADTFAHGRITNPTHPMWKHFETFYVLQHPTYMSMYPPGQGAVMAVGQDLFGHPIYGVWLSTGLMCAAICWMLYAWVSPRWALIGGLVAVLQFGVFTYWSQSYWGGAVGAIGGALVFGALPRIFQYQRLRDALWLGLGCAILANSRPLEGFLVAIPVGCLVLPWKIRRKEWNTAKLVKKVVLPFSILIALTIIGMGAYNKNITGSSKVFPQVLYFRSYNSVPYSIFQSPPVLPQYDFKVMEFFEKDYIKAYFLKKRTWEGFIDSLKKDSLILAMFFFGYILAIPSLAVVLISSKGRRRAGRFLTALLVILVACAVMVYSAKAHYFSPLTCLVILLVVMGLRLLSHLRLPKARIGMNLVIFLLLLQLFLNTVLTPSFPVMSKGRSTQNTSVLLPPKFSREQLKNILLKTGGKYLVIVRYPFSHNYHFEWVFNDADIDHAPIVWARDMGPEQNKELLRYFEDRQVLYVNVYWDVAWIPNYGKRQ